MAGTSWQTLSCIRVASAKTLEPTESPWKLALTRGTKSANLGALLNDLSTLLTKYMKHSEVRGLSYKNAVNSWTELTRATSI